jgi:hypothetical protein
MYGAVRAQDIVPINKASPLGIAIPLGVPMLAVASLQAPLGELLLKVVKASG